MKILFLSHKIPYPPNKGDRIPAFYRMQHLSKQHEVSLAFPCYHKRELAHIKELRNYSMSIDTVLINPLFGKFKSGLAIFSKKPLTLPYFYSSELDRKIRMRIKEKGFDLILIYSSSMAQYVEDLDSVPKVIDLADADSHKWLQYSEHTNFPMSLIYRLEYKRLKEYEKRLAESFDSSIAISEDEKRLFGTYLDNSKMHVVSNGVDIEYYGSSRHQVTKSPDKAKSILFVGAMDYFANVDAVTYFCRKIFPLIKERVPEVKFYIVGSSPTAEVKRLASEDKSVVVTGFVPDVRPYLASSSVFVAPFRIARGIQNKILQAMASGVPVVTSERGNEGISAKDGDEIFVADRNDLFADNVVNLLNDKELRMRVSMASRRFVEANFRWERNMEKLEGVLEGLVTKD
ncbi:MAG: TIGR03087 family PEP-CTERM/XrtA system glycosyltransferase [Candidatus Omnitrophota bacterium]